MTATKAAGCTPKKGAHKRSSGRGAPKKDRVVRNCKGAIRQMDPSQPTIPECVAESRTTVALLTGLLSTSILQGSPAKKTGSGDSSQMSYKTEKLTKLEKIINPKSTARSVLMTRQIDAAATSSNQI